MITKDELIAWATGHGWKLDRFGHLQRVADGGHRHRLKLSRIAVRFETKSAAGWVRIQSGYFKDLTITADEGIVGMNF